MQERAGLLAPGMYVPRLELMSLDGSSATIGESVTGAHEILFLYNTTCPFCRAIMPVWKQVADRALNAGSSVHGLSVDGVAETARYSREHELNFPTLILATDRTRALLGARAVPQTLVIDPEGRVVASWMGGLSPVVIDSLLDFARIQSRVD
ncbi:MAG: TlpA family protein disulfide reductase [Vicinamibacterales bacterium]